MTSTIAVRIPTCTIVNVFLLLIVSSCYYSRPGGIQYINSRFVSGSHARGRQLDPYSVVRSALAVFASAGMLKIQQTRTFYKSFLEYIFSFGKFLDFTPCVRFMIKEI